MNHSKIVHKIWLAGLLSLASWVSAVASPVRVACVGDSITWGFGISNRAENSYPAQLAVMLGTNWEVHNFGINGTTLLHQGDRPYVKQRAYVRALAFKPDVVVIDFGANDSKHRGDGSLDSDKAIDNWQYKTNFVRDYEEMIAAFREANPQARIYICLPTPDYPGRWGINDKTIREEMIPMIRQAATESDVMVIDLYTALSGRKELFPDTVHPDAAGARLMAAAVSQALTGHAPPNGTP
jgi:acyl-CoA thioesterase-1